MTHRIERVNSLIRQEISDLLQREVKDPRLSNFVSVTAVSVSPDLSNAKIYVSCLGSDKKKQEILNALAAASGFFRKELAGRLRLRRVPELNFQWDDSIERGARLIQILDQLSSENTSH
jgi:ribosome-binding factor A